jgi:hypothetical protein
LLGPLKLRIATLIITSFPARLLRAVLVRGVTLWLLARIVGKAALASVGTTESGGALLPAWVILMTASLTLVDLHRRRELTLLHNLGISTAQVVSLASLPAVAIEALLVMLP